MYSGQAGEGKKKGDKDSEDQLAEVNAKLWLINCMGTHH
jgi:hypothetical protein